MDKQLQIFMLIVGMIHWIRRNLAISDLFGSTINVPKFKET